MTMPMMPGLAEQPPAENSVESLATLLDGMDPDSVAMLEGEALAWLESAAEEVEGEEPEEAVEEETTEEGEEVEEMIDEDEGVEDLEDEAAEPPAQQEAEIEADMEDFGALSAQVEEAADEAMAQHENVLAAIESARDIEGVDQAALDAIEEECAECATLIEEKKAEAEAAIEDEEATLASELGIEIRKKAVELHERAEKVTQLAGDASPPLEDSPTLLAWAEKYRGIV